MNPKGLVPRAIAVAKKACPDIGVFVDIALDPYTSHGHDGVLDTRGNVDNDTTVEILTRQAVLYARAGADVLAPSDMMDGRIGAIHAVLERAALAAEYARLKRELEQARTIIGVQKNSARCSACRPPRTARAPSATFERGR